MTGGLLSGTAIAAQPDAANDLPKSPNPTATVTKVCYKLDQKGYSQLVHATCYSEMKRAVVVLISGNAQGMSGQKIAEFITKEFEKAHVPAVGLLQFPERKKVAIVYFLNGDSYGPYSGNNWQEGFKMIKTHAAQAWYQKP